MRVARGFTIIELMLVITILAIVITAGTPSFSYFIRENRLKNSTRQVAVSFQTARLKAINANRRCFIDFAPGSLTPADSFYTMWLDMDGDLVMDTGETDSVKMAMPEAKSSLRGWKVSRDSRFGYAGVSSGPEGRTLPADGVDFSGANRVGFNSRGEATSAGAVYLTGTSGSCYAVTVGNLGSVRTWRWESNQWK